jgi:integrase/recombinase XerD
MNTTVSIVHYKIRMKENGKYPVKIRVIHNRIHRDYKLGIDLTEKEFEESIKLKPLKQYRDIAAKITGFSNKANKTLEKIPQFTFTKFEQEFFNYHKDASDIFPFFEEYIQNLEEQERIKTAVAYSTAMKTFRKFHPKKLSLYDITPGFLNKFQQQLQKIGRKSTTIGIYIRALRTIYNYCISKGVIKKDEHYPFGRGKYVIPAGRNIKKALTREEIGKIFSYQAIPGSFKDRAKDFWMFSYMCSGMNFKDIAHLRPDNIDGDRLHFIREKTKFTAQGDQSEINLYIPDEAKEIIKKWKRNTEDKDEFLFLIINKEDSATVRYSKIEQFIQNTNKNMKRICAELGIEKKVTTYFSRHSAATTLIRAGFSINDVKETLGHKNITTTMRYIGSIEDDTVKEIAKALTEFK